MQITDEQRTELIKAAAEVREHAYAPYSKFLVGAALRTAAGKVFSGCNVENVSYGLAICAERNAICSAIANGQKDIVAIAIVANGIASPCGACRQFIFEFGQDIEVVSADAADLSKTKIWKINHLLTDGFTPDQLI